MITQERLREVTHYEPRTGVFTWRKSRRGRIVAGNAVGCTSGRGYRKICIDGKSYQGHRLAWLYTHGYHPESEIDHINRDRNDNRIQNLREVTRVCNLRNIGVSVKNTSGVKGVSFRKNISKWYAAISVGGKRINLGYYSDFDEAVCARLAAEQAESWHGCDSSSSAFKYVQEMVG